MKRIIAFTLALCMALALIPSTLADGIVKERRLRVYSSLDQSRFEITVAEKDGKVFAAADELAKIFKGTYAAAYSLQGIYTYLENDNEVNKFIKNALTGIGLEENRQTSFAITNGVTDQILKFDLLTHTWVHIDAAYTSDKVFTQLPDMADPIIDGDRVYVEFLPAVKALGAIVNVAKTGDAVSLYIPRVTGSTVLRDVHYIMYENSGFTVPYYTGNDEDVDVSDTIKHNAATIVDFLGDIFSGEFVSAISGQYETKKFKDVILAVAEGSSTPESDFINELWNEQKYIFDTLDSEIGLEIRFQLNNDCKYFYESLCEYPDVVEILSLTDPITDAAGTILPSSMDILLNFYTYQQKLLTLDISAMEAIRNVYDTHSYYLVDENVDVWGRGITKIAQDLSTDYYRGMSSDDIFSMVANYSLETILNLVKGAGAISELTTAISLPLKTGQILDIIGITIGIAEKIFDYDYGTYNYQNAMREMQNQLLDGYIDLFPNARYSFEHLQLLCDAAEVYARIETLYNSYTNATAAAAYGRVTADISEAILTPSVRENLSHATSEDIASLVFDNIVGEFDFWDFAEALGLESFDQNGSSCVSSWSQITDLDADGYPEFIMGYCDHTIYPNTAWYVMDADAGIVGLYTGGAFTNWYQDGDKTFSLHSLEYDPILGCTVISVDTINTVYGFEYNDYVRWNGTDFDAYLSGCKDVNYSDWYYIDGAEVSERKFKEREKLIGSETSDQPYENHKINAGSDFIEKVYEMMGVLVKTVPTAVSAYPDYSWDDVTLCQYATSFRFNKDRTLVEVVVADTINADRVNTEPWMSFATNYYLNTDGEIIYEHTPDIYTGTADPEHEAWLLQNGF